MRILFASPLLPVAAVALTACVFTNGSRAQAQAINTTFLRAYSGGGGIGGATMDPVTGKYYFHPGTDAGPAVTIFNNADDFASNTAAGTITPSPNGLFGTYITANNGQIFGRTNNTTSAVGRWDLTTGALNASLTSIPGMGGTNSSDTFNWSGYSAANFLQDQTGLYNYGHTAGGSSWQLNKMGTDLSILSTKTVPLSSQGWAFMINGVLFSSNLYSSTLVSNRFDFATGTLSSVNFTLTLPGSTGTYIQNTMYDPTLDRLYILHNNGGGSGRIYTISNASVQFGVAGAASAAPEPATLPLLACALLSTLSFARRSHRRSLTS